MQAVLPIMCYVEDLHEEKNHCVGRQFKQRIITASTKFTAENRTCFGCVFLLESLDWRMRLQIIVLVRLRLSRTAVILQKSTTLLAT